MGPLLGCQVNIPAFFVTNQYSKPKNKNSLEISNSKRRGSFEEHEQPLPPIIQHNSATKHEWQDLPRLEDINRSSRSKSGSLPHRGNKRPIIQHNSATKHEWQDLPRLEDISRSSRSKSGSLPHRDNKRFAKKRGEIRGLGQNLQYLDENQWVPAVFHHKIRAILIEEASRNGQYTYPRERGPDRYDVTSFLESQKNWGPDRDKNWAEILYVFQKPKYHEDPTYDLASWKFHGKIVIAGHDKLPILRFRDMPDTLSSALHGRDIEAMRRTDPRITHRDFVARMPVRHVTCAGTRRNFLKTRSIGYRSTYFRREHGLLSWIAGHGSGTTRNLLWEHLPLQNQMANSIRDLEPQILAEQREVIKGNVGKSRHRAGNRALTSNERANKQDIVERRHRIKLQNKIECPGSGDLDEGTKRGSKIETNNLDADGSAEPDGDKSRHHARHGSPKTGSMQRRPTIDTPKLADTYQLEEDYQPLAYPLVKSDNTANSPESTVRPCFKSPFQSIHYSSHRGWGWNSNYGNLPASPPDPDQGTFFPKNYPQPPSYNSYR